MNLFKESLLEQAQASGSTSPAALTALIVDDEVANLRVLRAMLGNRLRILEAGDGVAALELLSGLAPAEMPALVLSDQRMPRMSGVELFERLRELLPSAIRIMVSGFVDAGAVVDAVKRAGIFRFVAKPLDQNELRLTIDHAIEAYAAGAGISLSANGCTGVDATTAS